MMRYILRPRCLLTFLAFASVLFSLPSAPANADGIDVVWMMTRVGGSRTHPALLAAMVVGLMIVNYLLNVVVVGIPAARALNIKVAGLLRDLAVFTLLGQVADRVGAIAGLLLSSLIGSIAGVGGERGLELEIIIALAINFIFSGLAVAALALWYLRRRWGVERRPAFAIAAMAGVITNPAWAMLPEIIRG